MIKFALICDNGHDFESWFQSGEAFDRQVESSLITCPYCSSARISKAIMAPAITRGALPPAPLPDSTPPRPSPQVLAPSNQPICAPPAHNGDGPQEVFEQQRELRQLIVRLHEEITTHAENVGDRFVEEVHKIEDGIVAPRPIYGQASIEEARGLIEEGIEILPVPSLPDEWN